MNNKIFSERFNRELTLMDLPDELLKKSKPFLKCLMSVDISPMR